MCFSSFLCLISCPPTVILSVFLSSFLIVPYLLSGFSLCSLFFQSKKCKRGVVIEIRNTVQSLSLPSYVAVPMEEFIWQIMFSKKKKRYPENSSSKICITIPCQNHMPTSKMEGRKNYVRISSACYKPILNSNVLMQNANKSGIKCVVFL